MMVFPVPHAACTSPRRPFQGNAARRDIEVAHDSGYGLNLVFTQFRGHSRVPFFAECCAY